MWQQTEKPCKAFRNNLRGLKGHFCKSFSFCFTLSHFTNLSPSLEMTLPNSEMQQSLLIFSQLNVITQVGIRPGYSPTLQSTAKNSIMTKNAEELAFIPFKARIPTAHGPRARRLTTDFSTGKILLSKRTLFPTANKLSWKVSCPNTNPVQRCWTTGRRAEAQHADLCLLCMNVVVRIDTGQTERGLTQGHCRMGSS